MYRIKNSFLEFHDEYGYDTEVVEWLTKHTFKGELDLDRFGKVRAKPDLHADTPFGPITIVHDDYEEITVNLLPEDLFEI